MIIKWCLVSDLEVHGIQFVKDWCPKSHLEVHGKFMDSNLSNIGAVKVIWKSMESPWIPIYHRMAL